MDQSVPFYSTRVVLQPQVSIKGHGLSEVKSLKGVVD